MATVPETLSPFQQAVRTAAQNLAIQLIGVDRERLKKAYHIALTPGSVRLDEDADGGLVTTSSGSRYVNGQCPCEDYQQHGAGHWRKHRLALALVQRAQAPLVPVEDDDLEQGRPAPGAEAPASVNVYLLIAGREVQVTLRDVDETHLLTRLTTLLAQYPVAEPRVPAGNQAQTIALPMCEIHGVMMHQHRKHGET